MIPKVREKKMSILEQLKKLDEQRAALIAQAETEAKKKLDEALADYNALGHNLTLSEAGKVKKAAITRQRDPNKVCEICNFLTTPNHDGRKHRSQGDNKKPFNAKELEALGLKKA